MKFETKTIHAGQKPDPSTGAIMPPIFQTSTYVQEEPGKHKGYEYSRTANPTRTMLQDNLAALENGKYALAFSSGCGAMTTVMHLFKNGDHIVCCDDVYGGTYRLFTKVLVNNGIKCTFTDLTKTENLKKNICSNTKAVWIESPTNPLLKLIDIEAIASICKSKNIICIVDNTFMSPYFQNPLNLGADIVLHSTTKYLNGHSDVVGGATITNNFDIHEKLRFLENAMGTVPGPFDAWLILRGIKTLALRMKAHEANALKIATYLSDHPGIEKVIYPGLKSHPQHLLAKKQCSGFGGMVSIVVKGGLPNAKKLLKKTHLFSLAESLGGVESLIEHPASMTHAAIEKGTREKLGIGDGLVRLSVGIEHIDDLISDLKQALE
ncbi:MAG: cystathionine gamma-synthase [Deltaproteobacteria bacterium RIFCSPLOWO2_01_FULL_38_9]|nr:MAG: cystathionine gamma-synthase [Deltaproteobacteria bacterium RIFCSPLOWO2_01_FULL_38_9]